MVIVMKVVGIDLKKLFRNFKMENQPLFSPAVGYMAIAGYFLVDFDMKKKYVQF